MHTVRMLFALALLITGSNSAARMAITAKTTNNSVSVNARFEVI
jgi:hypothetical protein